MTTALRTRVLDERAARRDLRSQIAALEARGGRAPGGPGPRLLSLGELEAVRDALVPVRPPSGPDGHEEARLLLERMLADPGAHRFARVPLAALGQPGCGAYVVRPRLGLLGMLAGWWEVKLSSGCPLAMRGIICLVAAGLLVIAAPAAAKPHTATSFDGNCALSGAVSFSPALTLSPQPVVQTARAAGTCTGTFTDAAGRRHRLDAAPVTYAAQSASAMGSCLGGTASGSGALKFPYGRLRFGLSETRAAALPVLTLGGARSGTAIGLVTPASSQDPVAAVQACAGTGLDRFELEARLQTVGRISG
jgi:hypothetical protein